MCSTDSTDTTDIILKENLMENVRNFRMIKKFSLRELSLRSGISVKQIKLIESGDTPFNFKNAFKLAKSFGIKIRYLLLKLPDSSFFLNNSNIPVREKKSLVTFARYKADDIATLSLVLDRKNFMELMPKIDINESNALDFGKKISLLIKSSGKTISEFLEENGIYAMEIDSKTAFFKGALVYARGIPVVFFPKTRPLEADFYEIIGHELCHAIILRTLEQKENPELICEIFSKMFSKICSDEKISIGKFDFFERGIKSAWEDGKISGSRGAELLNIAEIDFYGLMERAQ